jgi:hypothetical protein
MIYIEYSYKQIGKDETWFQGMCKTLNHDKMKIKRELLLQRIRGSSDSPFDPEDLDSINANLPDGPLEEHVIMDYFVFRVYLPIDKDTPYLMGVDTSTGTNEDSTSIMIVDPYNLKAVANLKSPLATPVETAQLIAEIHERFVPKSVICIERNYTGEGIIPLLRQTKLTRYLYNNPDKMFVPDNVDHLDKHQLRVYEAENRKHWGVYTQGQNRDLMMASLLLAVQRNKERFTCIELVHELNTLIRKSSGKIEAASGYHDDVVMSYCIAVLVYEHGVRLNRWGIIKGMTREVVEMVQNREPTYDEIYASLPDNLRSIFPNPTDGRSSQISPDYVGSDEDIERRLKAEKEYDAMRRERDMHAKVQRVRFDNDNNIVVDDDYIKDMIEAASRSRGNGTWTSSQFDIADLFNE